MVKQKEKKKTPWIMLVVATLTGGGAFYASSIYLANQEELLREKVLAEAAKRVSVVVAKRDLSPGDLVAGDNFATATLESAYVSKSAVTPESIDQYAGHVLERPMSSGEPLLTHFLAGKIVERFSDLLKPGERSVTLPIDELASDSFMLTVGDFADIFILTSINKQKTLVPLLTKIKILSVGPRSLSSKEQEFLYPTGSEGDARFSSGGYGSVTVGVAIKDAAKLEMARVSSKIVFMLRNSEDKDTKKIRAINKSILVSLGLGGAMVAQTYQLFTPGNVSNGSLVPSTLHIIPSTDTAASQDKQLLISEPLEELTNKPQKKESKSTVKEQSPKTNSSEESKQK